MFSEFHFPSINLIYTNTLDRITHQQHIVCINFISIRRHYFAIIRNTVQTYSRSSQWELCVRHYLCINQNWQLMLINNGRDWIVFGILNRSKQFEPIITYLISPQEPLKTSLKITCKSFSRKWKVKNRTTSENDGCQKCHWPFRTLNS